MPCAYLFKKSLLNALNNMLQLSVSPEVLRQANSMIFVGCLQQNYSILDISSTRREKEITEQVTEEGKIASYIVFANRENVNATPF